MLLVPAGTVDHASGGVFSVAASHVYSVGIASPDLNAVEVTTSGALATLPAVLSARGAGSGVSSASTGGAAASMSKVIGRSRNWLRVRMSQAGATRVPRRAGTRFVRRRSHRSVLPW